ncbi:MAG: extracellular solute-binding protein, partial [Actinomycetota bacterium]
DTVDVVVESFEEAHPDITVEVFRAPTGELTARIAAEQRAGGLAADVLWLTDPLSMQQYQADGLLLAWDPEEMEAVPSEYRTETFFGTRILNLVVVHQPGVEVEDWSDLPSQDGQVALPDPGFAGSAFAAVAYFMQREGYGPEFYREMARGGGIQVQSPGDVVFGVAEGTYVAGVTLDRLARDAIADGSPLDVTWPSSGAIAIYSPIAVVAGSDGEGAGRSFLNHTLGIEAQEAIARTGWQPIRPDVEWETRGPAAGVDWESAFDRQDELLDGYRAAFGG